jgi:hypothetical protein
MSDPTTLRMIAIAATVLGATGTNALPGGRMTVGGVGGRRPSVEGPWQIT